MVTSGFALRICGKICFVVILPLHLITSPASIVLQPAVQAASALGLYVPQHSVPPEHIQTTPKRFCSCKNADLKDRRNALVTQTKWIPLERQ